MFLFAFAEFIAGWIVVGGFLDAVGEGIAFVGVFHVPRGGAPECFGSPVKNA